MSLNNFRAADQKDFWKILSKRPFTSNLGRKKPVCAVLTAFSSNNKAKTIFTPGKLDQLSNLNIGFMHAFVVTLDW